MFSLSLVFPEPTFKDTIQKFARQAGWNITELEDGAAMFQFHIKASGRVQTLFIFQSGSTLEFLSPLKKVAFESPNDIPHTLSTALLQRSASLTIGFWCVAQIGDQYFFSCMHNIEMKMLKVGYFRLIVTALIEECDMVEGILSDIHQAMSGEERFSSLSQESLLTDAEAQPDIERLWRMLEE
jgi:hypothetical protein